MHSDETLANRLQDLADNVDSAGVERVRLRVRKAHPSRWSMRRPMLATGMLGAAAAAAAILTLNATGVLGGAAQHSTTTASATGQDGVNDFIPLAHPGKPCLGGVKTPLASLPAQAGPAVWMPSAALANKTNLTGVWSCGTGPALTFGNISVYFEPATNTPDDKKQWFTDLAEQGHGGQVETLLGQPAFVDGPDGNGGVGEAVVVVGNTLIRVIGDGQATGDDLAAIVSSIDVAHPLQ
ncbi:hypothetical protein GCM10028801_06270 [Nocardioides maradonensis]